MPARRVMITAAASGIGRVMAEAFAADGAELIVSDIDEAALAATRSAHPDWSVSRVDVTDPAALDDWFDRSRIDADGLDVLINNAGIAGPIGPVEAISLDGWRQCMAVGIDAQFVTCRRAVPIFKRQRHGTIINMSSTSGLYGVGLRSPYVASKWAVIGFTKSLAIELGDWNVTVNAICPGVVAGDRMTRVIEAEASQRGKTPEEVRAEYVGGQSIKRFVDPREIASLALYLASPAARIITGQALSVDGHAEVYHLG
jgi:NAD(P)-dependent dehydrogenase (short-subunit alcohol dehydrogenase family)